MIQIKFELRKGNRILEEKGIVIDYFDKDESPEEYEQYKQNYIEFIDEMLMYINKGYEIKVYKLNGK